MTGLVEFLLARIAEDEDVARGAANGPWSYPGIDDVSGGLLYDPTVAIAQIRWDSENVDPRIRRMVLADEADRNGAHIARHDPARVVADCEAKRRIVERLTRAADVAWSGSYAVRDDALDSLRDLALPYADREGYREEWRP